MWKPASKDEVLKAVEKDWLGIDPKLKAKLEQYCVEPYSSRIERYGDLESVFVVGRKGQFVVFFEDVEEIFGTAREVNGQLEDSSHFHNVALAMRQLVLLAKD